MPSRHLGRRRRARLTTIAVAAGLLAAIGPAGLAAGSNSASAEPAVRPVAATRLLGEVTSQSIAWKPCVDEHTDPGLPYFYYRMRCGTFSAPLNWDDPTDTRRVQLAVSKLPATKQPAAGVLFTNPGGPGEPGLDLPLAFASAGRTNLLRTQDVYGIDVRGTGASSNVTCGGSIGALLDPRQRSSSNVGVLLDGAQLTAQSCAVAGGDLIRTVNTSQTVRDLDLLRSIIEVDKINWLGYSAGTQLGVQYATAFPDHVRRMVLDSTVDVTGSWQQAFGLQPMGFQRRFDDDFLPWAARYDSTYHLGATAEAVQASYERVRASMTPDSPVPNAVSLDQLLVTSLYDSSMFPVAAETMHELDDYAKAQRAGNVRAMSAATVRVAALRPKLPDADRPTWVRPLSSDSDEAAFWAVTCNDASWSGDRTSAAAQSAAEGEKYPLVGWSTIYEPCLFWGGPTDKLPTPTGEGLGPILMVQSTHDPATPIEGARRTAAALGGVAHVLPVADAGDHGLYAGANSCVNKAVEVYLSAGTLPTRSSCPGTPLPTPDSGLAGMSVSTTSVAGLNPLLRLQRIQARLGRS